MKKVLISMGMIPLLIACSQKEVKTNHQAAPEGTKVKIEKIEYSRPASNLKYSGTIEALVSTPLSFQTTGTVDKVYVRLGEEVSKGQIIASVDKTSMQSAYDAAVAQYNQAVDAQSRLKSVYEKGSLPEIKWVEINSQLAQAESQMKMYKENLDNCELRSPIDGIIGYRSLEVGMLAIQMKAPIHIINIDQVLIKISVPENEVSSMKAGHPATMKVAALGMKTFFGEIEEIGVVANQLSRTYDVKILTNNSELSLRPGMVCDVEIELQAQMPVLLVSMEAVSGQTEGNPYVYVVNPTEQRASKKYVQLGGIINNKLEVLSGLAEGDIIVTYGKHKLSDNDKVVY